MGARLKNDLSKKKTLLPKGIGRYAGKTATVQDGSGLPYPFITVDWETFAITSKGTRFYGITKKTSSERTYFANARTRLKASSNYRIKDRVRKPFDTFHLCLPVLKADELL